ncbi:MAG: hypothetical protein KDI02_17315 [Anaerolineae bacterium]|nr:hypothetical protein [Anaerolineae bacterium]MCB0225452.1 hypothetical protein [Anaerolineae bacterium]
MTSQKKPKQKPTAPLAYQAYLIRLWQDGQHTGWRASVQSVQSGETIRFASLKALFEFLQDQTDNQTHHQLSE